MYKIVILFTLLTHLLFSATSEQVDRYMTLTHSDRALVEVEQMFSNLSSTVDSSNENIDQKLTLDYQIYLGKHISEDEMDELLALYRKPIMQLYVNEMDMFDIPDDEMESFLTTLKEEPLSTERQDIIDELLESIVNEELLLNFYNSMMQRYQIKDENQNKNLKKKTTTGKNSSKRTLTSDEKEFIDIIKEGTLQELLYGTQVLSLEELKEINTIMKSSLLQKVTKVENEATINIMNNFINNITSKATPKR